MRILKKGETAKYYNTNGKLETVYNSVFYKIYINKENLIHNSNDKAAFIRYTYDKRVNLKIYCKEGYFHRLGNKPARIIFNEKGKVQLREYYIEGRLVSYEESVLYNNRLDFLSLL